MNDLRTGQAYQGLPISIGAVSETGQREQNQDSMTGFSSPFGAVYLIADGMGGHHGGAEASRMVAEAFNRHLLAAPASSPARDAVTLAVRLANVEILEKGKSGDPDFQGMGSTVVIALVRQNAGQLELITAHVGDSRAYLLRNGNLTLLTKDHTQVQWLVDNHAIDESSARNHPDASVLTRALGHTTDLQVDISDPLPLQEGDSVLLCSDGLSGFARSEDINRTIRENPDPTACANQLVQLALAAGSNDNITVQFLRIGATAPAVRAGAVPPLRQTPRRGPSLASAGRLVFIVAFILVLAAMLWWFRRPKPVLVDNSLSQLEQRIKTFQAAANTLHDDAGESRDAVHLDLSDLKKLKGKATPKLQKELKNLQKEFPPLEEKFAHISEESTRLQQVANQRSEDLLELQKVSTQPQKPEERRAKIKKLTSVLETDEDDLQARQKEMNSPTQKKKDLEQRKEDLESAWKQGNATANSTSDQASGDAKPSDDSGKSKPSPATQKPPDGGPPQSSDQ